MSHNTTSEKLITRTPCLLGAIALAIGLVLSGPAACGDEKVAKSELPKLTDMQLPTADELLRADDPNGKAFDWIVLNASLEADRVVLVVSPLETRPDTLKRWQKPTIKSRSASPKMTKNVPNARCD